MTRSVVIDTGKQDAIVASVAESNDHSEQLVWTVVGEIRHEIPYIFQLAHSPPPRPGWLGWHGESRS